MEISKIRPYEGYYDNSVDRVKGKSGSDQISNPIENFSTGKMQSVTKADFWCSRVCRYISAGKRISFKGGRQ